MSSSEDYLDSLLRSMGVPAELASPTKSASKKEAEEPAKQDSIVPDAVFTDDSVTEEPIEEQATEEPVAEEPAAEEPAAEEPITEEAVVEEPVIEEPIIEHGIEEHFSSILSEDKSVPEPEPEITIEPEPETVSEPVVDEPAEEVSVPEETVADVQMSLDDLDLDSLMADISSTESVSEETVTAEPSLEETVSEEPVIDHSADIPDLEAIINEDPAASDIHIDSAPSLEIPKDEPETEADLSDLMNDLMKQIEPEIEAEAAAEPEPEITLEPEPISEPEPEITLESEPAVEPEPESEPEITLEPEPIPEPEPEITLEPEPSAEPESTSDANEDDLDAQLAALLNESGISLDENNELEMPSVDDSIFVDEKPVADVEAENDADLDIKVPFVEGVSDSDSSADASDKTDDVPEFDLDAELAELMKEENESADLPGEDDIEAMLNKAKTDGLAEDPDRSDMSLDELLAADSGSASDIGALLDKNDNNEAVGEEIEALLNGSDDVEVPDIMGEESSEGEEVLDKAAEKKRLREEKKEAKRKAKEEKARLKAEKKAKKLGGAVGEENVISNENAENADMSDVDALLAGAAEAAAEVRSSAVSEEEPATIPDAAPEPEPASEPSPLDETDSLLAEIMGSSFDEEEAKDVSLEEAFDIPSSDGSAAEPEVDPLSEIRDLDAEPKVEKKKGLIAKIIDMLTETDEDESSGSREIKLSEENATVLEELDAEGEGGKGKKKKKKKGKKDKNAEAAEMDGVGDEVDAGDKKGKKKKEKKPKKEKAPAEDEKPSKKLNKKKVIAVFGLCLTILVAVLIVSNLMGSYSVKREARQAYSEGDYQTAYQDLFGQDLNESDQIIFKKSECILRIRLWQREYELLKEESDVKALDSLIQTVNRYPGLYASAVKWGCLDEVEPIYKQLLSELESRYGLTEEEAAEIAVIRNDVDYTRAVYQVINGLYGADPEAEPEPEPEPEPVVIDDVIPGEDDPGSDIVFVNP